MRYKSDLIMPAARYIQLMTVEYAAMARQTDFDGQIISREGTGRHHQALNHFEISLRER